MPIQMQMQKKVNKIQYKVSFFFPKNKNKNAVLRVNSWPWKKQLTKQLQQMVCHSLDLELFHHMRRSSAAD